MGLVPHFSRKFEKFPCFYFSQNQPEKCVWRISRKEKSLFRLSGQEVKKVEKIAFFKISIFWTFLKLHVSGLKSILFHPECQKTIFSGLICPKKRDDRKFDFFDKNHGLGKISNLVPGAFPSKNGWGRKRPWHRLVACLLVHPKIRGVIN